MTNNDFNVVRRFIDNDEYFFILVKKLANLPKSTERTELNSKIRESAGSENILHININILHSGSLVLQGIPKTGNGNSFIIRGHVITNIVGGKAKLDSLVQSGLVYVKHRSYLDAQQARKTARNTSTVRNACEAKANAEAILNKTNDFLDQKKWVRANKIVLTKKSTKQESVVFRKLEKSLKKRVKSQVPFTINGNVYFADICIKCKRLIIEVDGGYHNGTERRIKDLQRDKDFASIGYSTIRLSNDEVDNPSRLSEFIKLILNTPHKR